MDFYKGGHPFEVLAWIFDCFHFGRHHIGAAMVCKALQPAGRYVLPLFDRRNPEHPVHLDRQRGFHRMAGTGNAVNLGTAGKHRIDDRAEMELLPVAGLGA